MGNEAQPQGKLYKSATICNLTGYSPLVIRAWERRHKLLEPQRSPSGHRLYTEDDLRVLLRVKELIGQGLTIGEVAARGRRVLLAGDERPAMPATSEEMVSRLVRAAVILDQRSVMKLLEQSARQWDEQEMLERVLVPSLHKIGLLWEAGRASVAAENVLSQAVRLQVKQELLRTDAARGDDADLILCATVEDEQHDIGVYVVAAHLARAGHPVLVLGPRIPLPDLDTACHLRAPAAVCVSFKLRETFDAVRLAMEALALEHRAILFVVGGHGVAPDACSAVDNLVYFHDSDLHRLDELIRLRTQTR